MFQPLSPQMPRRDPMYKEVSVRFLNPNLKWSTILRIGAIRRTLSRSRILKYYFKKMAKVFLLNSSAYVCIWGGGRGANLRENKYRHICEDNQCMTKDKNAPIVSVSCSRVTICAYIIWHKIEGQARGRGNGVHCKKRQGTIVIFLKRLTSLTNFSLLSRIWLYTRSYKKFLAYWGHFAVQQCTNYAGDVHYLNPIQVSSWLIDLHIFYVLTLSSIAECNPVQTSAWLCWPTHFSRKPS